MSDSSGIFIENNVKISELVKNKLKTGFISIGEPKEKNRMIMVIGGRCQGKSSFAKEHFENRVQEKGKTQEDHQKDPKADHWADGKHPPGKNFLLPPGAGIFTCWYTDFKKMRHWDCRMSRKQLYLKQHLQVFTTGKIWQKPFITPTWTILVTD